MKKLINIIFIIVSISILTLDAARKPSFKVSKNYTKKAPYAGYGQKSSINGKIKTKTTRGYFKPSNRYQFVNPYARSK